MEILHSKKLSKQASTSPTQKYLDVAEVKEDMVILKNGALRAILAVSAINFDLKSSEEQEAIIGKYQNFLNSIDFPLQILISSRKINMQEYLDFLTDKEKAQPNELLRLQISEYKSFIDQLVSISNIMEKSFYIIVPFASTENKEGGVISNLAGLINPQKNILDHRENFEAMRNQLLQRVDHVNAALSGIGLKIVMLKTEELIELLFNSYNPEVFNSTTLKDTDKLELMK